MTASGATVPQRAPASIDMLHKVKRPSIVKARIAEPANSTAYPLAPSAPIAATMASTMSLAETPGASTPSTLARMRFGFFCQIVCVISTCATSDAPMPNA